MNDALTRSHQERSTRALQTGYEKFTRLMRWSLLLAAMGIIGTVFVTAMLNEDPEQDLDLLISRGEDNAPRIGLENARFSSKDSENQRFYVTARSALHSPDNPDDVDLENLQADMEMAGGMWVSVSAPTGVYQRQDEILLLDGGVNIFSDRGYEFHTEAGFLDMAVGRATFPTPVRGQGPFGNVTSDSGQIEKNGQRILLEGNVKLTILGAAQRDAP